MNNSVISDEKYRPVKRFEAENCRCLVYRAGVKVFSEDKVFLFYIKDGQIQEPEVVDLSNKIEWSPVESIAYDGDE